MMSFELEHLALVSLVYLLTLFLAAWATEKNVIPKKIIHHPAIYVLSLGIYASSWVYYGSTGVAFNSGYAFLAFYFGLSGAFLLAPVLLTPILRITSAYQLSSLPDLLAFRFRSPAAGTLSTLLLLYISLPLLALQIKAISDSVYLLSNESSRELQAIIFCTVAALFTLYFGTRHLAGRRHHHGLIFAIAFESLLKLTVMLVLGGVVVYQIFDGPSGLNQWVEQYSTTSSQIVSTRMNSGLEDGPWRTTLLMFFASAIVMPHMFHMTFTENRDSRFLYSASWGLPLFLMLLSFSTPLVLWAGIKLGSDLPPEYYSLAIGQALNQPWLTVLAYLGGLSAATGLTIVTTLTLSSMLINHLVLPFFQPTLLTPSQINIYRWLTNIKRCLIIALIAAAYIFYRLLDSNTNIHSLGVVAYTGAMQLLPATLSTLYWKKANRQGFLWGLSAGIAIWMVTLMLPMTMGVQIVPANVLSMLSLDGDNWHLSAAASLLTNVIMFYLISQFTAMRNVEKSAAEACLVTPKRAREHQIPQARSASEFQKMLSTPLGTQVAQSEVKKALDDLHMQPDEHRPRALSRLRDRIENNLSGLMGPSIAHDMVESFLPLDSNKGYASQDIHFIESQLESYHSQLTGLAAELDGLRRYHRETLKNLPMAVCSVDNSKAGNNEVMLWNHAMVATTGVPSEDVLGIPLKYIPGPWNTLISDFLLSNRNHLSKHPMELDNTTRYFSLHKADSYGSKDNQVVVLEDQTETHMLEEQLFHNERLASIGQLAAGVAHEIGNPITGIDCLAQELNYLSDDPDIRTSSTQILEQTKRVSRIVQSLVTYAHSGQRHNKDPQESIPAEPVSIFSCAEEAINLLKLSHKNDNILFINDCNIQHRVSGNDQKLQQVFINLLKNASDASGHEDTITVKTSANDMTVTITIEDQGHGIPEHIQEKLFEPFFTTKEAGKGTGLGLALTWNIIKEHFGSIQVVSPADTINQRGTRFIISLPRYEPEYQAQHNFNSQGETV